MSRSPGNADVRIARAFHDRTAHSPQSVRTSTHTLDWDVKPFPFKVYADLEPIPLPRELDALELDVLAALQARPEPAGRNRLTLTALATVLYFSAGVTKKKRYPGGAEVLFRAAASTGALYQTEVYVAAGAVEGLAPGLYHFNPGDFALRQLRAGDVRGALAGAAADEQIASRAATVILSAIYWRNTWKYQARGYRHLFWDSGTMLANLLAVSEALGLAPALVTGFVDDAVNHLLGVDAQREAALELVGLGPTGDPAPAASVEPVSHRVVPLSSRDVEYPLLTEMHQASALPSPEAVRTWRQSRAPAPGPPGGPVTALPPPRAMCGRSLGQTIQQRGSTREFGHAPLSAEELATILATATSPIPWDVTGGTAALYLAVNAVDGIEPGAYRYWTDVHGLERLRHGLFRNESAFLCLEQPLGGDAAAVIYFLAPLDAALATWGNRGYRLVNLEAGIAGGRAYLSAYGQGAGASGLTFHDRQVVAFFSPHAQALDAIFVTALGRSRTPVRSDHGRIPVASRL